MTDQELTKLCAQALAEDDTQRLEMVLGKIRGALADKRNQPPSLGSSDTAKQNETK